MGSGRSQEASGRQDNPLGFALDFLGGKAHVTLARRRIAGFVRLERLALEVPRVSFPFDVSGGAGRFRHRRCRLRWMEITVESEAFGSWLTSLPELSSYGFDRLRLTWGEDDEVHLEAVAVLGDRQVPFLARVRVEAEPDGWVRVELGHWQVYGYLPVPAELLGMGLWAAAGRRPVADVEDPSPERVPSGDAEVLAAAPANRPPLFTLEGTSVLRMDLLGMVLRELLPAYGWRLPSRHEVGLEKAILGPEGLSLSYALGDELVRETAGDRAPASAVGPVWSDQAARPEESLAPGQGRPRARPEPIKDWGPRGSEATRRAENLLALGRLGEALRAFEECLAREPGDAFARLRCMEILACAPRTIPEARRMARRLLAELGPLLEGAPSPGSVPESGEGARLAERALESSGSGLAGSPEHPSRSESLRGEGPDRHGELKGIARAALFLLAATAEEQGEPVEAASRYAALSTQAERSGDHRGAVLASLACGRLLTRSEPEQAISWYERALGLEPDLPEATTALTVLYRRQGRLQELLRLMRRHLARASDRKERLRGHLTLGNLYLDPLQDALRARAELERAVRLDDGSLAAWDGLAEAHRLAGNHDRERRALERVVELSAARGDEEAVSRARLRMARAWAEAGDLVRSLEVTGSLLVARPTDPEVLELHGLTSAKAELWDGAAETLERLLALEEVPEDRRSDVALELARIHLEGLADPAGARIFVEASLAFSERTDALRLALRLAEAEGRWVERAELLGRLADRCATDSARAEAAGRSEDAALAEAEAAAARLEQARLLGVEQGEVDQALSVLSALVCRAESAVSFPAPPGLREGMLLQIRLLGEAGRTEACQEAISRLGEWLFASGVAPREEEMVLLLGYAETLGRPEAGRDRARSSRRVEALRWLRRLHTAAPQDPRPLVALTDLLGEPEEQAEREGLLERLALVTERKGDATRQAAALRELGILRHQQGRLQDSLAALGAAAILTPDDGALQAERGEVAYALSAWEEAGAAFEAAARGTPAPAAPARVSLRRGQLALRAGELLEGIRLAEEALASSPPPLGSLAVECHQALLEGLSQAGRWREAAAALESWAADGRTLEPPSARAASLFAAAEIQRRRVGDAVVAERLYEAVSQGDPDHLGAMNGLTVLYAGTERWDRVADLLERKLTLLAGTGEVVPILEELAALYSVRLQRPEAARSVFERILEREPDRRDALRFVAEDALACGDLEVARGNYLKLLALGEGRGEEEPEARERLAIHWALARIALKAREPETALGELGAVLALSPMDAEALVALDDLCMAESRWEELAEVLRRRADRAQTHEETVALLLRLAALLEDRLGRPAEAASVCREVLRREPNRLEALARSAALLRRLDAEALERRRILERLIERLPPVGGDQAQPPVTADGELPARSSLLLELGFLLRRELGEPQAGARLLQQAIAEGGDTVALHRELAAIAREEGRADALERAILRLSETSEDPAEREAVLLELAEIRLTELGNVEGALGALEALPAGERPDQAVSLEARCRESSRQWQEAYAAYDILASRARLRGDDQAERAALERMLGLAIGERRDLHAAEQAAQRLLALDPHNTDALDALATVARRQRRAAALLRAIEQRAALDPSPIDDTRRSAEALCEAARLCLRTGDALGAMERVARAVQRDPDDVQARILLAECHAVRKEIAEAASTLEELARRLASERPSEVDPRSFLGRLYVELASLASEGLGDGERARRAWRAAAGQLSDGALIGVLEAWAESAAEEGRWGEAAEVAERLRAQRSETADAIVLAEAYEHLGRVDEALRVLRDAPAPRANNPDATVVASRLRDRMRDLLGAAGRFGELARTLEEDARRTADPNQRRQLLLEAAKHYLERAGEGGRAQRCLQVLLEEDPLCLAAVRGLLGRAEASPRNAELEPVLERSAEAAAAALRTGASREAGALGEILEVLSSVAHHRLQWDEDDEAAQRWLGAVLAVAPARRRDLEGHEAYLLRIGQPARAVGLLEAALAASEPSDEDREVLRVRTARLSMESLSDPAHALELLLEGGIAAPRRGEALALEADLMEGLGRLQEAEEALLRLAEERSTAAPLIARALALADRRGDQSAAIRALWKLVGLASVAKDREEQLVELERRCEVASDFEGLARALEGLVVLATSPEERAARLLGLGRVRIGLERWEQAQDALVAAAKAAPGTVSVHRELARVAQHRGDLEAARVALATAHDLLPELAREERAAVSLSRSQVEVELGGDRALARRYARQAAEETQLADLRAEALRLVASLAAQMEEAGHEEEALRALLELGVANTEELERLATLCEGRDAWAEALGVLEHLRERDSESPEVHRRLAAALVATGQRGRAVGELVAAAEHHAARGQGALAAQALMEAASLRLADDAADAKARALLLAAVAADPEGDASFGMASRVCRQQRDHEGHIEALRRRLPALDAHGQQAAYREMATIAQEMLRDPDRAASLMALGLVAGGDEPSLLSSLLSYHTTRLEWRVALDYGMRLDAVGGPPPENAFEVHSRLAEGALAVGDRSLAMTHLRRALAVRPSDIVIRQRLESLLVEDEDHGALMALWKERAAGEEGAERAATLGRAAELCERSLGDLPMAEQLVWEALEASPEDEGMRERLLVLLRRRGRWQPLFEQLRIAHERARGPRRAEVADELAEVAERQLGDSVTAQHYRRVALRDAPADVRRLRALVDLLGAERKWAELTDALEEALHTMVLDAESASGFYALLGRAYMEKLNRPDLALAVFERARARGALTPRSGELFAELLESSGRFGDLAALLEEVAEGLEDPAASQRLLVKRARVLADHLGRSGEAANQLLSLFRIAPQRRRKLGTLARKLFVQSRMYDEALRVLEEELQAATEPEQAEILLEQGELFEESLRRPADALQSYQRLLAISPGHPTAHHRVARLLFDTGEREAALGHVEASLRAEAPDLMAPAHRLAGNICVELDRVEEAEAHFEASLRLDPTDLVVVKELNHLYTAAGQWDRLAENMGRELALTVEPAALCRLWFRRGLVYRDMLDRNGDALRCFREASSADPGNTEVVAALREFALERGDWETSLGLLDRQLELEKAPYLRAQLLARRADLLENRLGRPDDALVSLEEALSLQGGTDEVLLGRILRLSLGRKDWHRAAALERELAASVLEPAAHAEALLRISALHGRAGELEAAWSAAREVLDGPSLAHVPQAADRLLELATSREAQQELLGIFEARLGATTDVVARGAILRHLLRLAESLGETPHADVWAAELLTADPTDRAAFAHRRRRLEGEGDFAALARLLADRLAVASRDEALDLLTSLGRLQRERLGDLTAAERTYDRLLALRPDDLVALDARADLAYRQGEFLEARGFYERMGDRQGSLDAGELGFRLGRIAEALGEEEAAVAAYSRAVATRSNHVPALEALTRLQLLHGMDSEALVPLVALCDLLPPSERALAYGLQLARLRLGLGRGEEAEEGLVTLAGQHPDKRAVLERLAEVQRSLGHWAALTDTLAELARRAPSPERRARILYEEGEVRLVHLHEPEAAARRFLQAADLAPEDPGVMQRLAEHYSQLGRWEEARKAFAQLLEILSLGDAPASDPRRGLATLGLALTSLLGGGEASREAPALIRRGVVEAIPPDLVADLLAPLAQGLHALGQASSGLRRVFDLVDSALGKACLPRWAEAAERLIMERPADLGLRRLLARLISRVGEAGVAELHDDVARFLDPPPSEGTPPPPERARAAPRRSLKVFGPAVTDAAKVPLRTLLSGLHPQLGRVAPPMDPSALGPEVDEVHGHELAALCDDLRGALEVGPVGIAFARQARRPVELVYSLPPVMLLDPAIAAWPLGETRFLLGRALEWVRSGSLILQSGPIERVQEILDSVAMIFGIPLPQGARVDRNVVDRLTSRGFAPDLFENDTMEALQVAFFNHYRSPVALDTYLEEERHVANRIGLLVGGNLGGALEALTRDLLIGSGRDPELPLDALGRRRLVHAEPELRELLCFGSSALFHKLRRHRSTLPRL